MKSLRHGVDVPALRRVTAGAFTAALLAAALAGCGGGSGGIPEKFHRAYVAGCTAAGPTKTGCDCIYNELTKKQGIDTEAKFKKIAQQVSDAGKSANPGASVPEKFRAATLACRSVLQPGG